MVNVRRSDLSLADGAELCGCVNTGDSMTRCCLGMRHPLKLPCAPQSNEHTKLFCSATHSGPLCFLSRNSLTVRWRCILLARAFQVGITALLSSDSNRFDLKPSPRTLLRVLVMFPAEFFFFFKTVLKCLNLF